MFLKQPGLEVLEPKMLPRTFASTNDGMVDDLVATGTLRSRECIEAFRQVSRGDFWPFERGDHSFADMPLRRAHFHLSAPHIYGRVLESLLPLKRGMSFLNVGSGTGYFSSVVAELIGEVAVNDGLDIWPENVKHAKQCCAKLGKSSIDFSVGNVYQLDIDQCMRYDRIYIGACANQHSKYLYKLLEVGGILVGPFQSCHSTQHLRRVVRQSETQFTVEVLHSVQFAPLVEPTATPIPRPPLVHSWTGQDSCPWRRLAPGARSRPGADDSPAARGGLPGVPFTFCLRERAWCLDRSCAYPASFRTIVKAVCMDRAIDPTSLCLPPEIWVKHILPFCARCWFECAKPVDSVTVPPMLAGKGLRRVLMSAVRVAGQICWSQLADAGDMSAVSAGGVAEPSPVPQCNHNSPSRVGATSPSSSPSNAAGVGAARREVGPEALGAHQRESAAVLSLANGRGATAHNGAQRTGGARVSSSSSSSASHTAEDQRAVSVLRLVSPQAIGVFGGLRFHALLFWRCLVSCSLRPANTLAHRGDGSGGNGGDFPSGRRGHTSETAMAATVAEDGPTRRGACSRRAQAGGGARPCA